MATLGSMTNEVSDSVVRFAPYEILDWIGQRSREEIIHQHGFRIPLRFWSLIDGLPGAPLAGEPMDGSAVWISRGTLFNLAEAARTDQSGESALRLYWATLAWGTGKTNRNNRSRVEAIRGNIGQAGHILREAAELSTRDPYAAFNALHPRGRNKLGFLGPNFSTKFLYFAGAGNPEHPCQIVDSRALATAYRLTGDPGLYIRPGIYNYDVGVYLNVLTRYKELAGFTSTKERTIYADEVERWAFSA